MSRLKLAPVALLLAGLSGCGGGERPPQPMPAGRWPSSATRPSSPAPSNAAYVARAASIDLFVIGSSRIALQRSLSPRVRKFAQMMIDSHQGMSGQLSLAGRRLNLLPSATLQPNDQSLLDQLQASVDFDGTYRRQLIAVHEEAANLQGSYAVNGQSPTLRPVAEAAAQRLRRHLQLLIQL